MPDRVESVQEIRGATPQRTVTNSRAVRAALSAAAGFRQRACYAAARSDRIELPGDILGNSPKIADIGLAYERVAAPLVPPIQQVDVLTAIEGR